MKLRIEKWVEDTKPFSAPVNELFTEAVNNYKFGSYRSAFIMAYLSFKLTIRERIINCTYGSELKKKNPNFFIRVFPPIFIHGGFLLFSLKYRRNIALFPPAQLYCWENECFSSW